MESRRWIMTYEKLARRYGWVAYSAEGGTPLFCLEDTDSGPLTVLMGLIVDGHNAEINSMETAAKIGEAILDGLRDLEKGRR